MTFNRLFQLSFVLAILSFAVSCAVNPVTGKSELSLLDETQEVSLGTNQYGPTQQSQGGPYTRDRALTDYVQRIGNTLAKVSDRNLPYEFVVIDDSTPNAWALPGGKIGINRGLLVRLNSEAELAAVLSHEIVHAAARHSAKSIERGLFVEGVLSVAGAALESGNSSYSGVVQDGARLGSQILLQSYGREAELESDAYGMVYMVRAGYDPEAAVTLQETFVALSAGRSSDWVSGLFASHPPSEERVARNRDRAKRLNPEG
ncbi:MAG: M48 family metalloprotease, partial [Pseudomonadales bacterium]